MDHLPRPHSSHSHSHAHKGVGVSDSNDDSRSLAESLPKWYKFDLSCYDGENDPQAWLCRSVQFFEIHKVSPADQFLFASLHFTGEGQI